jgi:prophage tail gpP-like protein
MPYVSDTTGDINDRVRLVLDGSEVLIAESWDTVDSVLSQPSAWSLELGQGNVVSELLKKYPPHTPYELFIGNAQQFTGRIDARGAAQPPGGGTTVRFRGRDALAPLESSDIKAELSIEDPTYPRIVWKALQAVGIARMDDPEPPPPDGNPENLLKYTNVANRSVKAGVKVVEILPVVTVTEFLAGKLGIGGESTGQCRGKVGTTWHSFIRHYLDRAGLFLWAAADGTFVLSAPNINQKPVYEIVRRRNVDFSNVVGMSFDDDTAHRHSDYTIYSHGGGKKHGASKAKGSFTDSEMVDYGFDYPGCLKDSFVQSADEAAYLARRKLSEQRRSSWKLTYTVRGSTLPVYKGANGARAVVTTDTIVHVDDEELGIVDDLYIESVRRRRGPGTTTEIRLMRREDAVFGGVD